MRKSIILATILILLVMGVSAREFSEVDGQEIPGKLRSLVGNQNINVYLDNAFVFSLKIQGGKVNYFEEELKKATLEAYSSNVTVNKVLESEDPVSEIISLYNSGDIVIKKKTIMNKIKFFFLKFFI